MPKLSLNFIVFLTALSLAVIPAQANNPSGRREFDSAQKLYINGDIKGAKAAFLEFVRKYPTVYQGHYQLANTYMRGGELNAARQEYAQAINTNPDITTLNRAIAAMGMIDKEVVRREALPQTANNSPVETSAKDHAPDDALEKQAETWQLARQTKVEKERLAILEDARKRASAVREAARKQLAELEANHNWICVDSQGRLVGNVVPTDVRNSILEPAEAEASRILAEGQRRADGLAVPGSLTEATASMRRQAEVGGSTPKIDLTQSSLTVRNYILKPAPVPASKPQAPTGTSLIAGRAKRTQ